MGKLRGKGGNHKQNTQKKQTSQKKHEENKQTLQVTLTGGQSRIYRCQEEKSKESPAVSTWTS